MPTILLESPLSPKPFKRQVAQAVVDSGGGIYFPFFCPIRNDVVAYVFQRTPRTDDKGRPVFLLIGIRPLHEMHRQSEEQFAEMPVGETVS